MDLPNFERAIRDVLTASDSSIGSSGGMTDVKIKVHSKKSLYRFLLGSSQPLVHTYQAAAMANTNRNIINPNVSLLFAVTRLTPNKIVLKSFPWEVLKPVRKTYATQPLSCGLKPLVAFVGGVC